MLAILNVSGTQFKVHVTDVIKTNFIDKSVTSCITLNKILLTDNGIITNIGYPYLNNVSVIAEVIRHSRDDKVLVFKKKRRKNYRKKYGHRQKITYLKIKSIEVT